MDNKLWRCKGSGDPCRYENLLNSKMVRLCLRRAPTNALKAMTDGKDLTPPKYIIFISITWQIRKPRLRITAPDNTSFLSPANHSKYTFPWPEKLRLPDLFCQTRLFTMSQVANLNTQTPCPCRNGEPHMLAGCPLMAPWLAQLTALREHTRVNFVPIFSNHFLPELNAVVNNCRPAMLRAHFNDTGIYTRALALFKNSPLATFTGDTYSMNLPNVETSERAHQEALALLGHPIAIQKNMFDAVTPAEVGDDKTKTMHDYLILMGWMRLLFKLSATRSMYLPFRAEEGQVVRLSPFAELIMKHHIKVPGSLIEVNISNEFTNMECSQISNEYCWYSFRMREIYARAVRKVGLDSQTVGFDTRLATFRSRERSGIFRNDFATRIEEKGAYVLQSGAAEIIDGQIASPADLYTVPGGFTERSGDTMVTRLLGLGPTIRQAEALVSQSQAELKATTRAVQESLGPDNLRKLVTDAVKASGIQETLAQTAGSVQEFYSELTKLIDSLTVIAPMALLLGTTVTAYCHWLKPTGTTRALLITFGSLSVATSGYAIFKNFPSIMAVINGDKIEVRQEADVFEFASAVVSIAAAFGFGSVNKDGIIRTLSNISPLKRSFDVICAAVLELIALISPAIKTHTGWDLMSKLYSDPEYTKWCDSVEELIGSVNDGYLPMPDVDLDRLNRQILAGESLMSDLQAIGKGQLANIVRNLYVELLKIKREVNRVVKSSKRIRMVPVSILLYGDPHAGKTALTEIVKGFIKDLVCEGDEEKRAMWDKNPQQFIFARDTDKFFNNATNDCEIVTYDDIFQERDAVGMEGAAATEIIGIVNQEPFYPRMAGADQKGKICMKPSFVVSTTNKKSLDSQVITDQRALGRRFHILLHMATIEKGLEIKHENFKISVAKFNNETFAFDKTTQIVTVPGLYRMIRDQYREHQRISREMNTKVDDIVAKIIEGAKEEEAAKAKSIPAKYASAWEHIRSDPAFKQQCGGDEICSGKCKPAILVPIQESDLGEFEVQSWTSAMQQYAAQEIAAEDVVETTGSDTTSSVDVTNQVTTYDLLTRVLQPIQIEPERVRAAGPFVHTEPLIIIEMVREAQAQKVAAATYEYGASRNGMLRRVEKDGTTYWYRPYFFNVTFSDAITFVRNYGVTAEDLAILDAEVHPDFKNGCFKLGDTYFPKDQLLCDAFQAKMSLNVTNNFWGVLWEFHAGTTFVGTTAGQKATLRFGIHWYQPGEAVQRLFMTAIGRKIAIPIPMVSWYQKYFLSRDPSGNIGYSVEMDSWAFVCYLVDTVMAVAVDPIALYDALKKKVPDMHEWDRDTVAAWVFNHTPSYFVTLLAIGASSLVSVWDTVRDKVREACVAVRSGFMWACKKVASFLTKHSTMITVIGSLVATALGGLFVFSKLSSAKDDDEEVVAQSGQGSGMRPKPARKERVRKVATKPAAERQAAELQMGVQKVQDTIARIQSNQFVIGSVTQDGTKFPRGVVTFTHERNFVTVGHTMRKIHLDGAKHNTAMYLQQGPRVYKIHQNEFEVFEDVVNDFARVEVRQPSFPQFKDIRNCFATDRLLQKYLNNSAHFEARLVGPVAVEPSMVTLYTPSQPVKSLSDDTIVMTDLFHHSVRTNPGDCGCLLVLADGTTSGQIIGYHIAGNGSSGFAKAICMEDLYEYFGLDAPVEAKPLQDESILDLEGQGPTKLECVPYDPDVHCGTVLSNEARIPSGVHARHTKEKFGGTGKLPMPYKKALSNVGPQYYEKARGGYEPTGATADPKLMYLIGQSIGERLRSIHKGPKGMRTVREAIMGIPGTSLKSMDVSTSSGYPWQEMGMPKESFWTYGENETLILGENWPLLHRVLSMKQGQLLEGGKPMFIYKDTLKAELRGIEKVEAGKSRLVSASPIDKTILMKMAFGDFIMAFGDNPIVSSTMIGVNPYGEDWNVAGRLLFEYCDGLNRCGATDYQGWDKHLNPDIGQILRGAIDAFYVGAPEDHMRMRHTLLDDCFASVHIRGEIIEKWCDENGRGFGWPSGNYLTAPGNSTMNLGTYIYHFLKFYEGDVSKIPEFWKLVFVLILGDDNLFAVKDELKEWFLETNFAKTAAELGMVMTSDVKGAVNTELRPMTEVSILKRKWRWEEAVQRWVAPQDLDTIIETCMWTQRVSYNMTAAQNMAFTVRELSLHGKQVYEEWLPKLIAFHPNAGCYEPWEVTLATTMKQEAFI